MDIDALRKALTADDFPRGNGYDPAWVLENLMGPNVLWLTEALTNVVNLEPGMRVLDLGCGKAVSSIFLAREFGVQVWGVDLWIEAEENRKRIAEQGLDGDVFPIHAEAHSLPFAHDFFDAIVSMDAYHYFGTDDLYLGYISKFLRKGGPIGIVVPGLTREFADGVPNELLPFWEWDFCSFHSPDWWRKHWEKTELVTVESAGLVAGGWNLWMRWLEICKQFGYRSSESEMELLRADGGACLGFTRMVARKRGAQG